MPEITIALPEDRQATVSADVFGAWAVHLAYLSDGSTGDLWTVTHVPTGLRACLCHAKPDAVMLARLFKARAFDPEAEDRKEVFRDLLAEVGMRSRETWDGRIVERESSDA